VREFIQDNESWQAQPWYSYFDARRFQDKTLLYNPAGRGRPESVVSASSRSKSLSREARHAKSSSREST
jgi:hypothetical protein